MKRNNCILMITLLLILSLSLNQASAFTSDGYSPVGYTSTYHWNFDGFSTISMLNDTHIDFNDPELNDIMIQNPKNATLTVHYATYQEYYEENIAAMMYNDSQPIKANPSYLINISTREYVNEAGAGMNSYANGFIFPKDAYLNAEIKVGFDTLQATAKENLYLERMNMTRAAWKLELKNMELNQTLYYDIETGILLRAHIETSQGSIGDSKKHYTDNSNVNDHKNKFSENRHQTQELIDTSAFETSNEVQKQAISFGTSWIIMSALFAFPILKKRK